MARVTETDQDRNLREALVEETGRDLGPAGKEPVSGGCMHRAWILEGPGGSAFVKANTASCLAMFEAERDGLRELAAVGVIRVPEPWLATRIGDEAFLVMERLRLTGAEDGECQGRQVAALHRRVTTDGRHGWHRNNFIGKTPQPNPWAVEWGEFFAEHRIEHQFRLHRAAGNTFRGAGRFVDRLPTLVGEHRPEASLLHGDLWGGNAGFDASGAPVLFDPAVFFGDRETDLAFTRMFGGFGEAFYRTYRETWPLPDGWRDREPLYNLYHVLNHALLFGGSYGVEAQRVVDRYG